MTDTSLPYNKGLSGLIEPHRSYRRLPVKATGALVTIPVVLIVELAVLLFAQTGLNWISAVAQLIAKDEGITARTFDDPFLVFTLHPMTFAMHHHTWIELVIIALVALIGIILVTITTKIASPLRFFINLNVLIVGGAAVFLLLAGHLGYDSYAFSQLMMRTAILTWLVLPFFLGLFSALFPFSIIERFALIAITVAYDVPLAIVRYACFIGILGKTGPVMMTDLYLVFGPLLDALPVTCFLSLVLLRVSRTLDKRRSVWGWF